MTPKVITDSTAEPISLTYARLHTKVDGVTDNDLFNIWIPAARRFFEQATGLTLFEKTFEMAFDSFPSDGVLTLPFATPLISVTSVKYTDSDSLETTVDAADYVVDTYSPVGRVMPAYGLVWPTFTAHPSNPIKVRYKGGLIPVTSPEGEVPEDIQQCIALLVGHYHKHRESVIINDRGIVYQSQAVEMAARSMISQHIVWRFA